MFIKICLTREDITQGECRDITSCAIARHLSVHVLKPGIAPRVAAGDDIRAGGLPVHVHGRQRQKVADFIARFDAAKYHEKGVVAGKAAVAPISFSAHFPEEVLRPEIVAAEKARR